MARATLILAFTLHAMLVKNGEALPNKLFSVPLEAFDASLPCMSP